MPSALNIAKSELALLASQIKENEKCTAEYQKANKDREGVLNRISDAILSVDNEWRYTFLNDAALATHPLGRQETLGRVIWEVHPDLISTVFGDKYIEAMLTKKAGEIESYYAPMNIWLSVRVYPSDDGLTLFYRDVTERKNAEQTLQQTLKEVSDYKFALDAASIVAITDQMGIIKHVNDNFCTISKYSKEELIGQDQRIFNSGYHSEEFYQDLLIRVTNGCTWRGDFKLMAKDGSFYWVDTTIVPFLNEENKPYQYVVIQADITTLKKAEEESIKAHYDKENLLNRISDGVVSVDNDWRYTFLNQASLKYHPVDSKGAVGKLMWEIYPELVGSLLWEKFHEAMQAKKVVEFEAFDPILNIWFALKVYPSWDGLTIIYQDVTESKQAEQELIQTLKEVSDYKFALDEASIVNITDHNGIIKYVNDNFCNLSKYNKEELIGQEHSILNSGYHTKNFIKNVWINLTTGKTWRGELKVKAKDDTTYWVDTTIVPLLNDDGKPSKFLAISSDITQRKQAEERILKMNEELEDKVTARTHELTRLLENEKELNEMKSRFVSLASHEFRTPLSTILSSVSLIESYSEESQIEKRNKHISRIQTSIKDLTDILNDFLSLDKMKLGKTEMNPDTFDLYDFCLDLIEEVNLILKTGQRIIFNFTGDRLLYQDCNIMKNVFRNLLSNASKYSADGQTIYLSIATLNNVVTIHVKDEGVGVPEEEQKHLFQKFFRAKNVITMQGTGLGLTIVKNYVEMLGGTIEFNSKLNQGSTFMVEIPQNMPELEQH